MYDVPCFSSDVISWQLIPHALRRKKAGGFRAPPALHSSLRPNDAGDKLDGGEEVPRSLLVSSGDRTKLLDLGKEVLDQMALAITMTVIVARGGPVVSRRVHLLLVRLRQRLKFS